MTRTTDVQEFLGRRSRKRDPHDPTRRRIDPTNIPPSSREWQERKRSDAIARSITKTNQP